MFKKPGLLFGSLGGLAVVFLILSAALGSSGTIEGDPDIGQQIANITFPLLFITVFVTLVLGIVFLVRRARGS